MGIRQSMATRELLKDTKIDICFTSDLQRAHKTAELILEKYHQDTPLVVDKRIKEKVRHDVRLLNTI
jgi:broad specificity phosphatase PhoE